MVEQQRDYYDVLGVDRSSNAGELKKAYRRLAMKYHPDRNPGDQQAEERFKEASVAYEILTDDRKRAKYDQFGHAGLDPNGFGGGYTNPTDLFEDIFGSIFGGMMGGGGTRVRRGRDLQYRLTVSLEEVMRGVKKEVTIPREESCGDCRGTGARGGTALESCAECGGSGTRQVINGFFSVSTACHRCRGQGQLIREKCSKCQGQGRVETTRRMDLQVPPGVDTGSQLRMEGEGEAGQFGGPRGDLYVLFEVEDHPLCQRHGNDLVCDVPISIVQAALGGTVEVPTVLDGMRSVTVEQGTQSGAMVRLRGQGVPDVHGHGVGDMVVRLLVEIPTTLTPEQRELLQQFAAISGEEVHPQRRSFMSKVKDLLRTDS